MIIKRFKSDLDMCEKFLDWAEALMPLAEGEDLDNLEFFKVAMHCQFISKLVANISPCSLLRLR